MTPPTGAWVPFRPTAADLQAIGDEVSEVRSIQQTLLDKSAGLTCPDRVAHQYQVAGSKVVFRVARELPDPLPGVGLFQPGAEWIGIGRISTGLGNPHVETAADFLGMMLAFQTGHGDRVDFLFINDPTSPADDHHRFVAILHATAASADAGDKPGAAGFFAQQNEFLEDLKDRVGWIQAARTLGHLTGQTVKTAFSSTAYQAYWSGIAEVRGKAGKFTLVAVRDENTRPGFHPGERHLSAEWKRRQLNGDIEFTLYWIPFLNEDKTPAGPLTRPWEEHQKQVVGTVTFPKADSESEDARLWAILASEMGANPGHWVHDLENSIKEPATVFGAARKIAYQQSQEGRGALDPEWYRSIFGTGQITPALAAELKRRRAEKVKAGHVNCAPGDERV